MANFSWKECKTGVAVLWDIEDGGVAKKFASAFDFGLSRTTAVKLQNLTASEFERMCREDKDEDFNNVKLFVIAGRHTTDALKGMFRGKLWLSQNLST